MQPVLASAEESINIKHLCEIHTLASVCFTRFQRMMMVYQEECYASFAVQ